MPLNRSTVGRLANISLRMNFGLLLTLLLGVFFVVSGYWLTYKVFRGELVKANYHFLNFVGRAYDQEVFLLRAINASGAPNYIVPARSSATLINRRAGEGATIYTGQASRHATAFSMVVPRSPDTESLVDPALVIGTSLTDFYRDFWSRSAYFAPQMFLLDSKLHIDIAVPSIEPTASTGQLMHGDVQAILRQVRHTVDQQPAQNSDLFVHWVPVGNASAQSAQLLAYVSMLVSAPGQTASKPGWTVVAATLMNLYEAEPEGLRIERQQFDTLAFDSIDLVAPDGSLLLGNADSDIRDYEAGFYLTRSGLVIKRSSGAKGAWQALYHIGFKRLALHARWELLSLVGLFSACLLGGWWVSQWYRRRIVVPARTDYSTLRQNHDFNHSLLQTVPLALGVFKGDELVTSNSLFSEWLGIHPDIDTLLLHWPLYENGQPQTGEGCLMLGARALHVRYAPTVYLNERVLLCTFTDISSHREASSTLVYARQAAEAANAEKSRFVATVSHEIRTPLYGVLGTLELLGLTELMPDQRAYLDTIDNSSELLLHVISDVLDMAKIESGQMSLEPVEFEPLALIERLLRGFSDMAANKGLALYSCIDPDLPLKVIGDGQRLRQVISNLLSNAIKFTEEGEVAIFLSCGPEENGRREFSFRICDTGPGIDNEAQQRLFEPFYQAENQRKCLKGTGLGLPICIKLCELMDATLTFESNRGEGSTFKVSVTLESLGGTHDFVSPGALDNKRIEVRSPFPELTDTLCAWFESYGASTSIEQDPDSPAPDVLLEVMPQAISGLDFGGTIVFARHDFGLAAHSIGKDILVNQHNLGEVFKAISMAINGELPEAEPVKAKVTRHLGLRVLLAEDNPVNGALMREQLENIGCTVVISDNGKQALEQLELHTFDLLLSDVNMPVMDGYALAEAVRSRGLELPIIGVTANALREEGEQCIRAGMNSWLSKPISIEGLYLCLQALGRKAPQDEISAPLKDPLQLSPAMRELFAQTIYADLKALRLVTQAYDPAQIARLLHRIRSALSVARARSLIQTGNSLEVALDSTEPSVMSAKLSAFIERTEAALIAYGIHPRG